ncbi:MAG: sulfatase-like hydrolase/transferase [Bacteroidia bacterium]|nr:sulfatase-like hydrolase/transferase [Bacteroidia bacterium]
MKPNLSALLMLSAGALSSSLLSAQKQPNVVLILIDDFGYECVTANGGQSYKTPVMDRLAETGMRFEQCYVQPLSTPSRVQLMTGKNNRENYTHFGHLDPSQKTFGNLLKDNGYATCIAGKWQLGNGYNGPMNFGFDEYCLWQLIKKEPRYKNPGLVMNGKVLNYSQNEYGPDIVSDYALDFITRKKDTPFFLYYTMMLTHQPYDATPDSPDYLDQKQAKGEGVSHFPDMTAYADKLIGKLITKLEVLNLRKNTLVLILGDNGTGRVTVSKFMGREVRGGKGLPIVWGTHVPCIASWPGHIVSGKVSKDLIDASDFLPTICEATGTTIPAELKKDSRSFLPQLRGEKGNPHDWLYVWYNDNGGAEAKFEFTHDANYKLYTDGRFFDVKKDELEKSPLVDNELDAMTKAVKVKLQAALKQFEGPRAEYFVKQGQEGKGENEADEDAGQGNKIKKEKK